jgi:TatD DNase family protein
LEYLIDIHTHSFYHSENTKLLLNVFPQESEKLQHPCFFSIGLHPWHVQAETAEKQIEWVEKHAAVSRVLAIGEIGFDKAIAVPWKDQVVAFEKQLAFAEQQKKPVILHCVRSYNEMQVYRNISNQNLPWIFHWFNAGIEIAHELIRKNCYLSFGHMLFNEKNKAFAVFKEISLAHIFLETDDAGYTIQETYNRAAEIKSIDIRDLKRQLVTNFNTCFGIQ